MEEDQIIEAMLNEAWSLINDTTPVPERLNLS